MSGREIARGEWKRFFDRFTRLHFGAIVNVNVSGVLVGCQSTIISQPLRGISTDRDDVLIDTGRRIFDHVGHRIPDVRAVRVQVTDEGAVKALDLDGSDGTHTTVRFRSPVLPELLDPAVE
jgi:uncharacterized protein DUF5335